jgi:hypothetical protein
MDHNASSRQFEFNPWTATPVNSIAFTSSKELCWRLISLLPYSIFPISNFRSFDTYLFVSDRILPAATVRTIEWMGYLRSVIRPTHWVTSILNIGKKMKNLSLFRLYRLLKRKPGDIYRFNALIRQFYRFDWHDFPRRCSFLIRWNSIQPIDPSVQTI